MATNEKEEVGRAAKDGGKVKPETDKEKVRNCAHSPFSFSHQNEVPKYKAIRLVFTMQIYTLKNRQKEWCSVAKKVNKVSRIFLLLFKHFFLHLIFHTEY